VPGDTLRRRRERRQVPDWLRRVAGIGALPTDSDEDRLRTSVLVLSATLMALLSFVWVGTYAALGLWVSAAIPFGYQIASVLSIYAFARNRRYRLFRSSQLTMSLVLPFALQWSLGGFQASSAIGLWALSSPVGALLFLSARRAVPWFVAFVALVVASAAIDPVLASSAADVPEALVVTFFALNILGVSSTVYVLLQYFVRERERALAESDRLLLNVLPEPIAVRLKASDGIIADGFADVTVLFADIVGFTGLAERLEPDEVVVLLDRVFTGWDGLAARFGVEKIKTIGDAYMVAGGLPVPRPDHAAAIADMALEMNAELQRCTAASGQVLEVRIGIDSGPVVAGVIGTSKFIYDLWGDIVNTASRMESHGLPGTIQVTERTYERLRGSFVLESRGAIEVKGKGSMATYLLTGRRETSLTDEYLS